jgi:hypothetical protein
VDASVQLQPRDFVLHQQLATFQCHDLEIIDRWVGPRFVNFRLEGPMTSFQFRKMGFYGHVVQFSSVRLVPDSAILHRDDGISKREFNDAEQQSSLWLKLWDGRRLERKAAKRDISGIYWVILGTGYQPPVAMTKDEERELQEQLARLQQEHRDLDAAISALQHTPGSDQLQVQRLKKRKLHLRDRISYIEDQLTPDIIA